MAVTMLNHLRVSAFVCGSILLVGCAPDPNKQPSSLAERQDAALKDPYGYKPDMNQNTDISGGGLFDLDKEAMRKDMDRVFNP
jgi:hypothetical protein